MLPGLGIDVGSRFTLMRYFALTTMHVGIRLFETAEDCLVELDTSHLPADVRGFFVEGDVAGIIATTTSFTLSVAAKYADQVSAELAIDEQQLRPLLDVVPIRVAFGRRTTGSTSCGQCLTSRCSRPIRTRWRCASPSATY